ncbi:MAG: hypothetical protein QXD03_03500 [Candidatus Anstonellales archaeon]
MAERILRRTNPDILVEKPIINSRVYDNTHRLPQPHNLDEKDINILNNFKDIRYKNQQTREAVEGAIKRLKDYIFKNNKWPEGLDRDNVIRILTNVYYDEQLLELIKTLSN